MMFGRKNQGSGTPAPAAKVAPPGRAPGTAATPAPAATAKGKLAYEARRAEKAGMGLEKWMAEKERRAQAERDAIARARRKADTERQAEARPGLLRRLLDRAHRPL